MSDLETDAPGLERFPEALRSVFLELTAEQRAGVTERLARDGAEKVLSVVEGQAETEAALFWVKGGKYDDPGFQSLKPLDAAHEALLTAGTRHFQERKALAVRNQLKSDLVLHSDFNSALMYTGVSGAVRCDLEGAPSEDGGFFAGVEFRLIGSVGERWK